MAYSRRFLSPDAASLRCRSWLPDKCVISLEECKSVFDCGPRDLEDLIHYRFQLADYSRKLLMELINNKKTGKRYKK